MVALKPLICSFLLCCCGEVTAEGALLLIIYLLQGHLWILDGMWRQNYGDKGKEVTALKMGTGGVKVPGREKAANVYWICFSVKVSQRLSGSLSMEWHQCRDCSYSLTRIRAWSHDDQSLLGLVQACLHQLEATGGTHMHWSTAKPLLRFSLAFSTLCLLNHGVQWCLPLGRFRMKIL